MQTMQSELEKRNTTLWNAYEHSYNIALKEWLPLFQNNKGSSNALPHLLGVTDHISTLLFSGCYCDIELTDVELYVALCAALMHDIGKAQIFRGNRTQHASPCEKLAFYNKNGNGCVQCKNCSCESNAGGECSSCPFSEHAQISHYVVVLNWADLGIYSEKLARIIGIVCCFHECKYASECHIHNDYYLEGYGKIRARTIAALLTLADHLDDTSTRAQPEYFRDVAVGAIGKFRNKVQYTKIDKKSKMICSVLDKRFIEPEDVVGSLSQKDEKLDELFFIKRNVDIYDGEKVNALYDFLLNYQEGINAECAKYAKYSPISNLVQHTYDNYQEIMPLRNEMYILKMPIKKWYIECEGHLFDIQYNKDGLFESCKYALEPIIDDEYCDKVFYAMRNLSGSVFGKRAFTYYDLLNYTHSYPNDYEKIKITVKRIEKLLHYFSHYILGIADSDAAEHIYSNDVIWTYYAAKGEKPKGWPSELSVTFMRYSINSRIERTKKSQSL